MKTKLAVIVVDYKGMEETCGYIKKFCDMVSDSEDACFVIVDNSQDSKNFDIVSEHFNFKENLRNVEFGYSKITKVKKYDYLNHTIFALKNSDNAGYARGNNAGAEYLLKVISVDAQYFLFSNNDIEFTQKICISDLLTPFEYDEKIAVVGPHILEKCGSQTSPRKKISIFKLLILYNMNLIFCNRFKNSIDDVDYTDKSGKAYWVSGCFLIVDAKKFFEVGMFDPETFLYSEEMILSERLAQHGYIMYYCNEIEVFHNHGKTINKHVRTNIGIKYLYQSHRLCCQKYRNTTKFDLLFADAVFLLYKIQFPIKQKIKMLFNVIQKQKK